MWKKTAIILIVLSIAMNLAFIGVWAVHAFGKWCGSGRRCGRYNENREIGCPVYRNLNVNEDQLKKLGPRIEEFRKASLAICEEVNARRAELIDLIAVPEPDMEAIKAKQEEILACQRKMQELVIKHLLSEKEILTPEQRKDFFRMFRQRSGCGGHSTMMGMPGSGRRSGHRFLIHRRLH